MEIGDGRLPWSTLTFSNSATQNLYEFGVNGEGKLDFRARALYRCDS